MKLSEGVEQAIHCTAFLAGLSEDGVLSAAALAELHGVSTSYLLKHCRRCPARDRRDDAGSKGWLSAGESAKGHQPPRYRPRGRRTGTRLPLCRDPSAGAEPSAAALLHKALPDQRRDAEGREGISRRTRQGIRCGPSGGSRRRRRRWYRRRGCAFLELHERKTGNRASS